MRHIAITLILLTATAMPAAASIIVAGSTSAYMPVEGAELSDVRLTVDLSVDAAGATMTFTNTSIAPERTAVFKEFVVDTYNDATHTAIFTNARILDASSGVDFGFDEFNGLPGYSDSLKDDMGMMSLRAWSPPTKKGLGIGDRLRLRFDTILPMGSTIEDYLAQFRSESDRADSAIGFHAISSTIVNGQSLTGMDVIYYPTPPAVPEPGTLVVLAAGAGMLVLRRRRAGRRV